MLTPSDLTDIEVDDFQERICIIYEGCWPLNGEPRLTQRECERIALEGIEKRRGLV
jgi:hypothetical protein